MKKFLSLMVVFGALFAAIGCDEKKPSGSGKAADPKKEEKKEEKKDGK